MQCIDTAVDGVDHRWTSCDAIVDGVDCMNDARAAMAALKPTLRDNEKHPFNLHATNAEWHLKLFYVIPTLMALQ